MRKPPVGNTTSTPRDYLKAHTDPLHRSLESALQLDPTAPTRAQLEPYLQAMRSWVATADRIVWNRIWPAHLEADQRGEKTSWITADLRHLGVSAEFTPAPLLFFPLISQEGEPGPAVLGIAYVLEGMTLGGQMMRRSLVDSRSDLPRGFWNGYGPKTGERWKALVEFLNTTLVTHADLEAAAEAASQTFSGLRRWLEENGVAQ